MKSLIRSTLKKSRKIYQLYFLIASTAVRALSVFVRTDNKVILFSSFAGKKYDDSPRAIYEEMRKDDVFRHYQLIWAFEDPDKYEHLGLQSIKIDTFEYFKTALKAKYWITNASIERGLKFKKRDTVYLNTWHGSPIKKMGEDTSKLNNSYMFSPYDYFLAQSQYDIDIFSKAYNFPRNIFYLTGLPRNDSLAFVGPEEIELIRKELNIPDGKKVVLYAPTYRDTIVAESDSSNPAIDVRLWQRVLSGEYILMVRAHYEQNVFRNIEGGDFVRDVSQYPELNNLLKVTDILISDYSSIMIDFSILERPIYCYIYDIDRYKQGRGLYFDIEKALPGLCFRRQEELLSAIHNNKDNDAKAIIKSFRETYVEEYGHGSKNVLRILKERL